MSPLTSAYLVIPVTLAVTLWGRERGQYPKTSPRQETQSELHPGSGIPAGSPAKASWKIQEALLLGLQLVSQGLCGVGR